MVVVVVQPLPVELPVQLLGWVVVVVPAVAGASVAGLVSMKTPFRRSSTHSPLSVWPIVNS